MNLDTPGRDHIAGSQSIQRAVETLKLVAASAHGARYVDLVAQTSLQPATAHRILRRLVAEGLLQQRKQDKRYLLGPLAFEIGLAASVQFNLRELVGPRSSASPARSETPRFSRSAAAWKPCA